MNPPGKLRALLATARVANLPSVVVNVWCGTALAFGFGDAAELAWADFARLALAGCCLYLAGTFANDWVDKEWDAEHRPERALPAGIHPAAVYQVLAIQFAVLGLALAAAVSMACLAVAAGILSLVVCYTALHKRTAWGVLPMGLCRAGLPLLGAAGVAGGAWFPVSAPALALLCYVAGLSLAARAESATGKPTGGTLRISGLMFVVPVALALAVFRNEGWVWASVTVYGCWLLACMRVRRRGVRVFVSLLLAGLPLVDWLILLPLGMLDGSSPCGMFALVCLGGPPLATILALALQRLAPAT